LFRPLHAVEKAAVFFVELFQPDGILLPGHSFVLLDGKQDGAGFVVARDGHGAAGGDLLEDVGGRIL
jgi:hypothetical protein